MEFMCKICSKSLDLSACRKLHSRCIFLKVPIDRYECPICGVIFGPIDWIEMTKSELYQKYQLLRPEPDTTQWEYVTFQSVVKENGGGIYLNFGAGNQNRTHILVKTTGNNMIRYDPFVRSDGIINDLGDSKFDGIISHNVIEHMQDPIEEFSLMKSLLKSGCFMAHSTACYNYAYEYSAYHLFFFVGKAIEHICRKVGLRIVKRTNHENTGGNYSNVIFKSV